MSTANAKVATLRRRAAVTNAATSIAATSIALTCAVLAAGVPANAAAEKPIAGKTVHFPQGFWSGLPQTGPDGKVRQCVMIASRPRQTAAGPVDTALSLNISTGSGLTFFLADDRLPSPDILDDEAEIVLDGRVFPAVAFTIEGAARDLALHPGDAAAVLGALAKTASLRLRSDGAGVDTGDIKLDLPGDALAWLAQCGKQFGIALDQPTDPKAPVLPVPRPREPDILPGAPVGLAGLNDKWKIAGWDASELRDSDGKVVACVIRQHYTSGAVKGSGQAGSARTFGSFLMATRVKGLTMMLNDSALDLNPGPIDASLTIEDKPFVGIAAQAPSKNEILLFPQHGQALAAALGDGVRIAFDAAKVENFQFSVPSGAVPWLRACTQRWGFGFEAPVPAAKAD